MSLILNNREKTKLKRILTEKKVKRKQIVEKRKNCVRTKGLKCEGTGAL
jgi:hypothetical protein